MTERCRCCGADREGCTQCDADFVVDIDDDEFIELMGNEGKLLRFCSEYCLIRFEVEEGD